MKKNLLYSAESPAGGPPAGAVVNVKVTNQSHSFFGKIGKIFHEVEDEITVLFNEGENEVKHLFSKADVEPTTEPVTPPADLPPGDGTANKAVPQPEPEAAPKVETAPQVNGDTEQAAA